MIVFRVAKTHHGPQCQGRRAHRKSTQTHG